MSEIAIIILIVGIVAFTIGFFLAKTSFSKVNTSLKEENLRLINELTNLKTEKEYYLVEFTKKQSENDSLIQQAETKKAEIAQIQEKFTAEFENLANKILDDKSSKFTEQNKINIQNLLNPLQEKIKSFEQKVETTHKESIDYHAALRQQIIGLKDLNVQMSKETLNLTKALKGENKTQGDWGETQLELLLEKANLTKGIHFSAQGGFRDESGKLKKPDFIINLPDHKHLIIDSKVSLTAYEAFYNSEHEHHKTETLKNHISSIRNHIKELGEKRYTDLYGINTPDYVLMFVPIEAALMLALSENNNLYLEALDKNVVLVSTSTLLATLSTVSSIWKQEDQKRNVLEIATRAGALYDKFEGFVQDLLSVGKSINSSKVSYDAAMNKLVDGNGNLIRSVESIKKLGAKAKKSIPQVLLDRAEENLDIEQIEE
ncbi:MAG: DNA recombination protein RmuC [Flavobacteriaceae bacterium]|nr:DNA recombination protein RmuC [Flavobacteriaceae bacterium]